MGIYESQQAIDAMRVRIMTISIYNRARRYYPGGLDRLASTAAHNPLVTDSPTWTDNNKEDGQLAVFLNSTLAPPPADFGPTRFLNRRKRITEHNYSQLDEKARGLVSLFTHSIFIVSN